MYTKLRKLVKAFGVSGFENEIADIIEHDIKKYVDRIYRDTLGNLICVKRIGPEFVEKPEKIMITAHMDTIGIIVMEVDDKGYIHFSNIGTLKAVSLIGRVIDFKNGIKGVVCYDSSKDIKDATISTLFIDTGLECEEVRKKITIGTYGEIVFDVYMQEDIIISGHLDNRAGCVILLDVMEKLSNVKSESAKEIYFVFSVQEELGLRGAGPAAYNIKPDIAIVVDTAYAEDTSGSNGEKLCMGKGPVIMVKDGKTISHPYIRERLKGVADRLRIKYQIGITEKGATDAGIIHKTLGGVVTGGLSVAIRYIHSPAEMCNMKDLREASEMLTVLLETKLL